MAALSPAALALRLYRDRRHEEPATDFAIDAGKIETIDGLATGTYEVRVELGEWWSPCVLAKGEAVIEAGATTQLALRVQAMPAPAKVVVRGTLVLPPQWRVQTGTPVSLMLWPLDRTHWAESRSVDGDQLALDAGEDAYRFALHGVLVGSYEVTALPAWHRHVVNVPETGIADLRIVVPPPGEVILRVLDGVTKEPRNGTRVWWHTARAAGGMSAPALAAVDSHEVRFLAPVGPIVVSAFGDDYVVEPHDIDVRPGENEIELSTKPICGVKVALYEGGIRIPLSTAMGWRVQLDRVTGETLRGPMRNQDTPTVLDSGRYVLKVETPDDYQPVPDRTVTLSSGPFLPIEIQVTRKQ